MTRNIGTGPTSARRRLESLFTDRAILCFLTISHDSLADPIRVVWDSVDYIYNGYTWTGFPFDITPLSDDDRPPRCQLVIQNVDPRIGDTIMGLTTAPRLKIEFLESTDFNIIASPRLAVSSPTPTVMYSADRLYLTNVQIDALAVTGDIQGWDYGQRVWPGRRARQDFFPGLFR